MGAAVCHGLNSLASATPAWQRADTTPCWCAATARLWHLGGAAPLMTVAGCLRCHSRSCDTWQLRPIGSTQSCSAVMATLSRSAPGTPWPGSCEVATAAANAGCRRCRRGCAMCPAWRSRRPPRRPCPPRPRPRASSSWARTAGGRSRSGRRWRAGPGSGRRTPCPSCRHAARGPSCWRIAWSQSTTWRPSPQGRAASARLAPRRQGLPGGPCSFGPQGDAA
mmetsp:Transcript_99071/g.296003  ORF Transcript_99071/g.296003 Transcript_99071/m.296003 type:complete len:222 (+) Transcript_99071:669-1334(+)